MSRARSPGRVKALAQRLLGLVPAYADGAEPVWSAWGGDRWARGAYSAHSLSSPLRPELAEPAGRIAFAGEHTAGEWHALMEGALRSGERAAADVRRMLATGP